MSAAPPVVDEARAAEARASEERPRGTIAALMALLDRSERRQLVLLVPAVVVMALFETAGVASILPFLALLANPEAVNEHRALAFVYERLAFTSRESFFFAVGLVVLVVLTVGNAFVGLTTWALMRFAWMRNHTVAMRLFEGALRRPYARFLDVNTSDLAHRMLSEVHHVVRDVFVSAIQLVARAVSIVAIVCAVLVVDPLTALLVAGVFGGLYASFFVLVQRRIAAVGAARMDADRARFALASEAFAGIKEVKLLALEDTFIARMDVPSRRLARALADSFTLGQAPRFVLESIGFGGVLLTVLLWLLDGRALSTVLPVLGLYAFGAYRLLPSMQVVFAGLTSLRTHARSLDGLARDVEQAARARAPTSVGPALPFAKSVALSRVSFRHVGASAASIVDVTLAIAAGEKLALVGPTGSGKSTLVDLLLGLLRPTVGALVVDGAPIVDDETLARWQANAGYVPQATFLADDTVLRNIAFGLPDEAIDRARVVEVATIAQIHDVIEGELALGYETVVGERGVRLSGGQRQRIGIARALYRRPRFLVLDEATSALDHATEARFFAALERALEGVTIVSIAHRLRTTRGFDRVIVVEGGRVVDEGTFEALAARRPDFGETEAAGGGAR